MHSQANAQAACRCQHRQLSEHTHSRASPQSKSTTAGPVPVSRCTSWHFVPLWILRAAPHKHTKPRATKPRPALSCADAAIAAITRCCRWGCLATGCTKHDRTEGDQSKRGPMSFAMSCAQFRAMLAMEPSSLLITVDGLFDTSWQATVKLAVVLNAGRVRQTDLPTGRVT